MANYCGVDGVELVSHGDWSDPELIYDGKSFNYWDIEDALWGMFCEGIEDETGIDVYQIEKQMEKYEPMFEQFVRENCVDYLEDCIFGGYFD